MSFFFFFWPEHLSEEAIQADLDQKFIYGSVKYEMLNRYLCGDVGLTDGDFEFSLEGKIWTGGVNMGITRI